MKKIRNTLPVQAISAQGLVSVLSPIHGTPPYCGSGLLHARYRVCTLPPQVTLHSDHWDQREKDPFTGHGLVEQISLTLTSPVAK